MAKLVNQTVIGKTPPTVAPPVEMRDLADAPATRKLIYGNVLKAAQSLPEMSNVRHTLRLTDVDYSDPEDFDIPTQKHAILSGRTLGRRLRGTWTLSDNATGQPIDQKQMTVARVPFMTDRGTFIHNGTEYSVNNQMRLRPGMYTRQKDNGEIESHANVLPGKGFAHRYFLDPAKGLFHMQVGQAKIPLMPLLKSLGATDRQLADAWGSQIFMENAKKNDDTTLHKLYQKLVRKPEVNADAVQQRQGIAAAMASMEMDPEVNQRTLGKPLSKIDLDTLLETTKKLLAVSRGEADVDDRDHLAYQTIHGPEDLFAERLAKDYGGMRRGLLFKSSFKGNLSGIQPSALTKQLEATILSSGLGQAIEEVNSAELLDKQSRISRMGEGAMPSVESIPKESRSVLPSHFGFIDATRTPESLKLGVDLNLASHVKKGSDNRIYMPVRLVETGEIVYKSPQDLANETIAFPGELTKRKTKRVGAMQGGKLGFFNRKDVTYELPHFEKAFSHISNLVPGKSGIKAQRLSMASRMLTQALPLEGAEASHVQVGIPDHPDRSYEEEFGKHMGAIFADQPGRVMKVTPDSIEIKYADGTNATKPLYNNFPYSRKTGQHNTALVKPGDTFQSGQVLAKSNYTDNKGVTALGLNTRVGWLPYLGHNFEDALVISRSYANRLKSQHVYQHGVEWSPQHKRSKRDFVSVFPSRFNREILAKMDDDGIIQPGQTINFGDPLILAAKQQENSRGKVHRKGESGWADQTETWDHHSPGIVTDVVKTNKGTTVQVKTTETMSVGDKMCYDPKTQVLTNRGWKAVADVTLSDFVASLNAAGCIEYVKPVALHGYCYVGPMYSLETTQVSLLVTDNHNLYVQQRNRGRKPKQEYQADYQLQRADNMFGKRYRMKRDANWMGKSPKFFTLPPVAVEAGQGGVGLRWLPAKKIPIKTFAMLLGMFLSEGSCFDGLSGYGIDISQTKPAGKAALLRSLNEAGIKYTTHSKGTVHRLYGLQFLNYFRQFGYCYEKFIPDEVFEWDRQTLLVLYEWLMWGDGTRGGSNHSYTTTSRQLADDVQRLLLHVGMSGNIKTRPAYRGEVNGTMCDCRESYVVSIYRTKNRPEINHGHGGQQAGQSEKWVDYDGQVYCVTLPKNHVLYVRRDDKPVWCGNSGLYGNKGVIAKVVEDDEMPHDESGQPLELLANPLGIISRGNPSAIATSMLGKIAAKIGKPYKLKDFADIEDINDYVLQEMKKHDVKALETVTDPMTGRKIPNIFVGNSYMLKLHHTSASKSQGRGGGGYSSDDTPSRGGVEGSKRLSVLDSNALLSSGAIETLRDAGAIRGQRNEEFWLPFMQGHSPPKPKIPLVYEKFVNELKGAGINVVPDGTKLNIMALTDKDVDKLAGDREITNAETVRFEKGMTPIKGGLFSPELTGGNSGNRWSKLTLHEALPSPVFEEPIRRILGLTEKKFRDVLAGKLPIGGRTGAEAIHHALESIDLDKELEQLRTTISSGRKTAKELAIRKLGYLKSAKQLGIHPKDWMLSKVPILPPRFRPISVMGGPRKMPLISDANYLYKELFDANQNLREMSGQVDDVGEERLALYDSFKAVTGLGEPVHPKLQEKNVKGILSRVFGSSPKYGVLQRKLISANVDLVGRAVIAPNPDLDMDSIGIPEDRAWDVYKNFIVRRLKRRGLPLTEAAQHVLNRTPAAKQELLAELSERPVIASRAPVLHRFGIMAFWPKLVKGDTMLLSPLIYKGFGADNDGDAMSWHVPVADEARQEAIDRLLPSRNLLSPADFKTPVHSPSQEYTAGLWQSSTQRNKKPEKTFRSIADVRAAFARGELDVGDPVHVLK